MDNYTMVDNGGKKLDRAKGFISRHKVGLVVGAVGTALVGAGSMVLGKLGTDGGSIEVEPAASEE